MRSWRIPHFRRSIGCVFQDFRLLPNRTAYENVAFALEVIGKSKAVARRVVPRCWSWSASAARSTATRTSSPVVSSSESRWPGRSSTGR